MQHLVMLLVGHILNLKPNQLEMWHRHLYLTHKGKTGHQIGGNMTGNGVDKEFISKGPEIDLSRARQ